MKISITSIPVSDQDKALEFYTEVLGFTKKRDIPMGDNRWLTVVSPEEPNGVELLLEPNSEYPAMKFLKKSLVEDGIPFTAFEVEDIQKEYERLSGLGVVFTRKPYGEGPTTQAVLDDTCGNLIQLYEIHDS